MASTPTRDLQDEFLAATRKSQETVVRAIKTWVETVRTVTPKMPSVYAPLADRLPKLPSVTDRLPKPEDVVASGYDFAEQLLALQRQVAEDLLKVTEPLLPGNGKSHAPAAKSAPKAPAAVSEPKAVVAETAPKAVAVPAAPKAPAVKTEPAVPVVKFEPAAPAAKSAPKPAAAKPGPKATPATRTPRSAAANSAPKPPTARRAPKSTGTN